MLSNLKQHAEANGNPLWGLSGPHDVTANDKSPCASSFFKDGGSWQSGYGDFFLSWYSCQLIKHGASLLCLASSTFSDAAVETYGKLPLAYSWYRTQSHPSELTAGLYNTTKRNGYNAISEMFSRNSCKMILPGLDMRDVDQPQDFLSSPEALLVQIRASCRKHGVKVSGENLSLSVTEKGLDQIKKNLLEDNELDIFYQRMGAYFLSPEHFPLFSKFIQSFNRPELHVDDLPIEQETAADYVLRSAESTMNMQVAYKLCETLYYRITC